MAARDDDQATLKRLVALRRQKAEQAFGTAKTDLREAKAQLDALQGEMAAIDAAGADYADVALSLRFGRSAFLMSRIDAQREAIARLEHVLHEAREALKKAIHSEERLDAG